MPSLKKVFLSKSGFLGALAMVFTLSAVPSIFAAAFSIGPGTTGLPVTANAGDTIAATGAVTVNPGFGLTINNNVTITMAAGSSITVASGGTLSASGTAALRPTFTSATANPGDWVGITFSAGSNGTLNFATIQYAQTAVNIVGANTTVTNCLIQNLGAASGANGGNGGAQTSAPGGAGTAGTNVYGILVSGNAAATITGNTIRRIEAVLPVY